MRFPGVKAEGQSFYHCVSRVVDRRFIFQTTGHGSPEAERFVLLMRRLEAFSGIRVLTYSLMSNHFHLLCEVPQAEELSEAQLLQRIQAGYGSARCQALEQELAHLRQEPDGPIRSNDSCSPIATASLTSRPSSKSSKVALPNGTTAVMVDTACSTQMPSPGKKSAGSIASTSSCTEA